MIISQEGAFVAGDHGFPVKCRLEAANPGIFAGVSAISLDLTRPNGTKIATRALDPDTAITDPDREIQFIVQSGDHTIDGVYTVTLGVDFAAGGHKTLRGDYKVVDE
jgi:hypothetical protein